MNDDKIFTEYELELEKARDEANKMTPAILSVKANRLLGFVHNPDNVWGWLDYFTSDGTAKILYNEKTGQFEPLTPNAVLDQATMTFVNPAHVAARDKENVKRLQEISGK